MRIQRQPRFLRACDTRGIMKQTQCMIRRSEKTTAGLSDASTAIALSKDWMLVADDESNFLRVLRARHSLG